MRRPARAVEVKSAPVRPRWARIEDAGDRLLVTCRDCNLVDGDRIQRLHALLAAAITPTAYRHIDLDLRDVESADTKLVAALVIAVGLAEGCGVALTIRCSPRMRSLIGICRLDDVLPLAPA